MTIVFNFKYVILMEINKEEEKIILLLRKILPYGKLEISMNQNGTEISCYLINPIKEVVMIKKD